MKLSAPGAGKVFEGPHVLLPSDKARHVDHRAISTIIRFSISA